MKRSPFEYSFDNKRYHTLNYYNKINFGTKIHKAVLDCGFTCPNKDGTKGTGGCIFCDSGSGYFTDGRLPLREQLNSELRRITAKNGRNSKIIAYFQANTNTYAPVGKLREIYFSVLDFPDICGISIGTRADCLSEEILNLLRELNERTNLTVELGFQTMHEDTINYINRCCTHEEFLKGFYALKKYGIRTCLHIINGLPHETAEMMLLTAAEAAYLAPEAVKLQMLHVIRGTKLEQIYTSEKIRLLSKEEYINTVVGQLEILPPSTVIERITGDGDKNKLIAPLWSADKISVLGGIDKRLAELDTWQGKFYKNRLV